MKLTRTRTQAVVSGYELSHVYSVLARESMAAGPSTSTSTDLTSASTDYESDSEARESHSEECILNEDTQDTIFFFSMLSRDYFWE